MEVLLALSGREGGAESLQIPYLHLVHEVEELPEHLDRQCSKRHFRHKQPNAKPAGFKKSRKHFILPVNLTTLRKKADEPSADRKKKILNHTTAIFLTRLGHKHLEDR